MSSGSCVLCSEEGGELIFSTDQYRVIWADEPLYPGFLRLIWREHIKEFSDLSVADRHTCVEVLVLLERFVLEQMNADKVNLATLGNVVPHLHWHIIPRFTDDPHFPAPVWASHPADASLSPRQKALLQNKSELIQVLNSSLTRSAGL